MGRHCETETVWPGPPPLLMRESEPEALLASASIESQLAVPDPCKAQPEMLELKVSLMTKFPPCCCPQDASAREAPPIRKSSGRASPARIWNSLPMGATTSEKSAPWTLSQPPSTTL